MKETVLGNHNLKDDTWKDQGEAFKLHDPRECPGVAAQHPCPFLHPRPRPGRPQRSSSAPQPGELLPLTPNRSSSPHTCSHPGRLSTLGLGSGCHPDGPLPALETSTVLLTQQVQGHKTFPKAEPSKLSPTVTVTTVPVTARSSPHVQLRPPPRQAPGLETSLH